MAAPHSTIEPAMEKQNMNEHFLFEAKDDHDSINNEGSSTFDYDDFPLDDGDDGEYKEDYFDTHYRRESISNSGNLNNNNNNNAAWVQLLNLPPQTSSHHHHTHGVPVGGMRRVSSCYFSIASNISNDNNSHSHTAFHSPNPSYHNSSIHNSHHYSSSSGNSVLSFEGRNASDFLLHDILMNVFSFLDANSLASFSETGRRPNFEVFYFLELQLQRACLLGEGNYFLGHEMLDRVDEDEAVGHREGVQLENDDESDNAMGLEVQPGEVGLPLAQDQLNNDEVQEENNDEGTERNPPDNDDGSDISDLDDSNVIPSFEGSIAGTGVISRLSALNNAMARQIVQTYLDSNTSLNAMPLSHSLAYFRQVSNFRTVETGMEYK